MHYKPFVSTYVCSFVRGILKSKYICEDCYRLQNIQRDVSACKLFCMHVILDHSACVCVQCLTGRLNLPLSIKKPPALLCSAWSWIKPGLHIWSCWVCYLKYTSLVEDCLFCSLDQQWAWIQSSGRVFQLAWAGT